MGKSTFCSMNWIHTRKRLTKMQFVTITFFQYWRWEQRNPAPAITSGSWFLMTNLHLLQCSIEEYYFQATVAGNQIPDVTCYSSLKAKNPPTTGQPTQPPLTTQKPGTTQPPATTQPPVTTEPGWVSCLENAHYSIAILLFNVL